MEVKLINYTPNPDKTTAAAAFTSWKKLSTKKLFEQLTDKEAFNFLRKVLGFGHVSVTEHASFTFSVEGISRACSHQLVRHRIASYTQQSQRYIKFKKDELEYVIPPSVKNSKFRNEYHQIMEKIADLYQKISVEVPVEDARYILPNASYTNIVITMNARELNYFFNMRLCTRAQWEIRELAERMLKEVKPVAPILFEKAGPNCEVLGYCPEGDLSCGKTPTKKQLLKL
jgi:thymidylate synthase (FAD)